MQWVLGYIEKEKIYVFAKALSPQKKLGPQIASPQIAKIYRPQIANPQIVKFAEGSQI